EMIFRSSSIPEAIAITGKILSFDGPLFLGKGTDIVAPVYGIFAIAILMAVELSEEYFPGKIQLFNHRNVWVRQFSYAAMVLLIVLAGVFDGGQFIYFAF
ncbi:MAG: MBOAT family protein, partial [Bacteroidota bacterium]